MRIVIGAQTFECPTQAAAPVHAVTSGRDWQRISVLGAFADVMAAFVDNAEYRQEWDSIRYLSPAEVTAYDAAQTPYQTDTNGLAYVVETMSTDLSDYCIAGDVVDSRNGIITVYMGAKTQTELDQEAIDELMLMLLEG